MVALNSHVTSRTSIFPSEGVFFDCTNTSGNTVRPRGFSAQPVDITGVYIARVSYDNPTGGGTLDYTQSTGILTWAAPGESAGTGVDVSGGGLFRLSSATTANKIDVWVWATDLPGSDQDDSITITDGGLNADWTAFDYTWRFGDSGAGNWTTGATKTDGSYHSKNEAGGQCTAHVYASTGTHNGTLAIKVDDASSTVYDYEFTITVAENSWTKTYYIADDGNDSVLEENNSQETPWRTWSKAIDNAGPGVKLCFKRDDTFTTSSAWTPTIAGALCITDYGEGTNPPKLSTTMNDLMIRTTNIDRSLITNFWMEGNNTESISQRAIGDVGADTTIHNCKFTNLFVAFDLTTCVGPAIFSECVSGPNWGRTLWIEGCPKVALIGCDIFENNNKHPVRVYTTHFVMTNCTLDQTNADNQTKVRVRIVSSDVATREGYHQVIENNNLINAGISLQNQSTTNMPKQVVLDGNEVDMSIEIEGGEWVVVRNNRVEDDAGNQGGEIILNDGYLTYAPKLHNIRVLHNTAKVTGAVIDSSLININDDVDTELQNFIGANNVLTMPDTSDTDAYGIWLESITKANRRALFDYNTYHIPNAVDDEMMTDSTNTVFTLVNWRSGTQHDVNSVETDPVLTASLGLESTSPCRGAGSTDYSIWCRKDCNAVARPTDSVDMGAHQYQAGTSVMPIRAGVLQRQRTG